MGEGVLEVIEPGIFTTIQDLGRKGFFASGIPPAGAMDRFALRMGNLLVKNPLGEAGVEFTAIGMKVAFIEDTVIAITGADFAPTLNGNSVSSWQTIDVRKGDVLSLDRAKSGWRGYLCVAGGIAVPPVLGSKSTYSMGGLGGYRGRTLRKGDVIGAGPSQAPIESLKGRKVKEEILPEPGDEKELRVVLGPQDDHVKDESIDVFLNTPYRVFPNSNRVGYRFEGEQLYFKDREESKDAGSDPSNIVDDGNAIGAIQIPAGKEPICLGPDGVTMGGYVKIACLITADMDRMAQLRLQEYVKFRSVTVDEAFNILDRSVRSVQEDNILKV
ncbi:MAG: biotin-dependent carboxyltransferase [Deltaproteobacteria bacterium]|nr:biotin-dependent carboxyltransferase [Deltaproteobacteria bacterium]